MNKQGLIHIYAGEGKGKTTAALGLLMRACGAKKKACLIRFLKPGPSCELGPLKRLGIRVTSFKEKDPFFYKGASVEKLRKKVSCDIETAKSIVEDKRYNIIVLDEILYLLSKRLLAEEDLLNLIKSKPASTELILTGRFASKSLLKLADYVSGIRCGKHPYKRGVTARKGIEY